MVQIAKIVEKIKHKKYEFSRHALDQSIIRGIGVSEMEQAILENAIIIEDYPNDKYGPSCLRAPLLIEMEQAIIEND